jgi:hypothetical protein
LNSPVESLADIFSIRVETPIVAPGEMYSTQDSVY